MKNIRLQKIRTANSNVGLCCIKELEENTPKCFSVASEIAGALHLLDFPNFLQETKFYEEEKSYFCKCLLCAVKDQSL